MASRMIAAVAPTQIGETTRSIRSLAGGSARRFPLKSGWADHTTRRPCGQETQPWAKVHDNAGSN